MYAFYYYPQRNEFLYEATYDHIIAHIKKHGRFYTQYNSVVKEQNLLLLETNDPRTILLVLNQHPYKFKKDIKSFSTSDYPEYFI